MTVILIVLVVVLAVSLAVVIARQRGALRPAAARPAEQRTRRILFPFTSAALSPRALAAALRLARAEDAVLVPVFLARVPLHLPLDSPLPRQAETCNALQEVIEHRAAEVGVPVDARIERGRTFRHALRQTIAHERFDRIVIAAAPHGGHGFDPDDVAWLLDNAQGEIVVLRPGAEDNFKLPESRRARRGRTRGRTRDGAPESSTRLPVTLALGRLRGRGTVRV